VSRGVLTRTCAKLCAECHSVRVSTDSPLRILYVEVVGYLRIGLIRVFIVLHFDFTEPLKNIDHYFITASKHEIWR
jgi:hypothetical protein